MKNNIIYEISKEEALKPDLLHQNLSLLGHTNALQQIPKITPKDEGKRIFFNRGQYYLEEEFDMQLRLVNNSIKDFSIRREIMKAEKRITK